MTRANARDEWRQAALANHTVVETAATALAAARVRQNHAAAEGVDYP